MAEEIKVRMGEGSPEHVAYKLLYDIAGIEKNLKDRKTLLDTYAECLQATKGTRPWDHR